MVEGGELRRQNVLAVLEKLNMIQLYYCRAPFYWVLVRWAQIGSTCGWDQGRSKDNFPTYVCMVTEAWVFIQITWSMIDKFSLSKMSTQLYQQSSLFGWGMSQFNCQVHSNGYQTSKSSTIRGFFFVHGLDGLLGEPHQ